MLRTYSCGVFRVSDCRSTASTPLPPPDRKATPVQDFKCSVACKCEKELACIVTVGSDDFMSGDDRLDEVIGDIYKM
jgi:hypothetical protein